MSDYDANDLARIMGRIANGFQHQKRKFLPEPRALEKAMRDGLIRQLEIEEGQEEPGDYPEE